MRRLSVAGNWKMNTTRSAAVALARGVARACSALDGVDVAVCPPFVYLSAVADALVGSRVALGAQNLYFQAEGAYTGEISGSMLKDIGCTFVIVGHSERRHVLGESDEMIARKASAALAVGLQVILCVGETIDERRAGRTHDVVRGQVRAGLNALSPEQMGSVVVAYEPVWAIGTGENATPEQAQEAHQFIRALLADAFGIDVAEAVRIQYGGSVKPDNARELMGQPDVDGALVGGASLKADSFAAIAEAGAKAKSCRGV